MKNVLIVSHGMEIGGAESALIGLLDSFDYSQYNVDLFLLKHTGEFMEFIPSQVNVLPENKKYASLAVPLSKVVSNRAFFVAVGRYLGKRKSRNFCCENNIKDTSYVSINNSHKYTKAFMPQISDKEYDIAVSFLTPHYFVTEKVKAKVKIAWIHTDYSSIDVDVVTEEKMWREYDNIISISPKVSEAFIKKYPALEDKLIVIENIHPSDFIRSRANEFEVEDEMPSDGAIKFLSVGRYTYPKNFDNVPDICRRILDLGIDVKWYIIGFGSDEEIIKQKIAESGMNDKVILLGKKTNPYPYFKACDFYVQPSRYEGNSVTVNEALILGKPVVVTDYATADSQINNGIDGVIVPLENEKCASGIVDFINNKELQNKIISKVIATDYSKSEEINKLYKIIGG